MTKQVVPGPGTVRVARFVGRLGVVSLPAVEVGLDLDQRVVRRHVAKLEAAGWLARAPWVWGEGSVVWLTGMGIECAGLGGLRVVKSPPAPTTIAHGVRAGWSAARVERRRRVWKSSRELAVDRELWAVRARCERGYTEQLPDLAVWLKRGGPPVALIAESGGRREDRQKMILEGWRDAAQTGRYAGIRYDCTSASVAQWINRLAKKVWLTAPTFTAAVQMSAEGIAALSPAADASDAELAVSKVQPSATAVQPSHGEQQIAPARAALSQAPDDRPARAAHHVGARDARGVRRARAADPRDSRGLGPTGSPPVATLSSDLVATALGEEQPSHRGARDDPLSRKGAVSSTGVDRCSAR